MNRLHKILFGFCIAAINAIAPLHAQLGFNAWSNNYFELRSYLGYQTADQFNNFQFVLDNLSLPQHNWSLSVRLLRPIVPENGSNISGKPFPPDKFSFRWRLDNGNIQTNPNTIGASQNDILLQNANEVFLINRSKAALLPGNSFMLYGSLKVASGKYLEDYVGNWIQYLIPVVFTLYDETGNVLGSREITYRMQVSPTLTDGHLVDVDPEYSLEIAAEATNASLRFLTRQDYLEGVVAQFNNAVKVNSKTNFELRLKSLDTEFVRSEGGSLPLTILSTQLTPGQGANTISSNPRLTLSTNEQVLLSGTSQNNKAAQYFNLNYRANLTRAQTVSAQTGTYSVSLLYLLMPK